MTLKRILVLVVAILFTSGLSLIERDGQEASENSRR